MKVLVACERSQVVCKAFRAAGHSAFSCDILPAVGDPDIFDGSLAAVDDWHIQADVLSVINAGWDLIIAFPPCTYLSNVCNSLYDENKWGLFAVERKVNRSAAVAFFMSIYHANCDKIAIENPVGCISSSFRKPDQIIHPYFFGDPFKKKTCLWLQGLPPLRYDIASLSIPPAYGISSGKRTKGKAYNWVDCGVGGKNRSYLRSKTFPGVAAAMAAQWG